MTRLRRLLRRDCRHEIKYPMRITRLDANGYPMSEPIAGHHIIRCNRRRWHRGQHRRRP